MELHIVEAVSAPLLKEISFNTVLSSILVALCAALFLGAAGLVGTNGPLKNSNSVLTKLAADYREAVSLAQTRNKDLLELVESLKKDLEDTKSELAHAETKIRNLSLVVANVTLENNSLKIRIDTLEHRTP